MDNKLIKEVPIEEIEIIDVPLVSPDNPNLVPVELTEALYGNENLTFEERKSEVSKRSVATLKANQTKKARSKYKKGVQNAVQALMDGTYCTLKDGSVISGAEIIALQLFERAIHSDDSAKLLLKLSGDLNDKDQAETNSYEEFIKNVTPQF